MLVKLLKFELKAMSKVLLPLYAVTVSFTITFSLLFNTSFIKTFLSDYFYDITRISSISFYVSVIIAMEIVTFIVIVRRMYCNLLGDDGYLMNTIPVKASHNVLCKTISAAFWNIIATIIFCTSVIVILYSNVSFQEILSGLTQVYSKVIEAKDILQGDFYLYIVEIIFYLILSEIAAILIIYASICIGHLFKRKIIGSIGAFIIIEVVMLGIATIIDYFILGTTSINDSSTINSISQLKDSYYHLTLISSNLLYIFITIVCFNICNYIIDKKLNLV